MSVTPPLPPLTPLSFPPHRTRARLGQRPPRHGDTRAPPRQAWQRPPPLPHRGAPPAAPRQAVMEPEGVTPCHPPAPCPLPCWFGQEHHPGGGKDGGHPPMSPQPCRALGASWWHGTSPSRFAPRHCRLNPLWGGAKGCQSPSCPFSAPTPGAALGVLHPFPTPTAPPCWGRGSGGLAVGNPPGGDPLCHMLCPAAWGPLRSLNAS